MQSACRQLLLLVTVAGLAACGGGGGGGGGTPVPPVTPAPAPPPADTPTDDTASVPWVAGVFQPSSGLAAQCAAPRAGSADVQGSAAAEKSWLRSWTQELYLWYREVQDVDPNMILATSAYFDLMKTFARDASGAPKDRFHFTMPTSEWRQLAQSGVDVDYGAEWVVLGSPPVRQVVVAYTHPSSPAAFANLARGTRVLSIDGVDIATATTQTAIERLNAGLSPRAVGEAHQFVVQRPGMSSSAVVLQAAQITRDPVQHVRAVQTPIGVVGYLLFTDHLATAEQELIDAIETLRSQAVTDLVLDLRYNGGGFLDIASELAYMIAGPARTGGLTFEALRFNDQHPATNPVTGAPLVPLPFHSTALGFSASAGTPLPTLDLGRVFVLTGSGTCSASESIMNGLRGIGVEVIQSGATTCGKPYGFYPADNCGTTYFSIQFQGVNAHGFGDYGGGFSPTNGVASGAKLRGCAVIDDFAYALGDPLEPLLAAALHYRDTSMCPSAATDVGGEQSKPSTAVGSHGGVPYKSPWLQNRILTDF
jgi:hypothetical protein